eukprot:4363545-Pyramimonas_sp.AAC.1
MASGFEDVGALSSLLSDMRALRVLPGGRRSWPWGLVRRAPGSSPRGSKPGLLAIRGCLRRRRRHR